MAKPPMEVAPEEKGSGPVLDEGAGISADVEASAEDEGVVLCTICKEPDGTYTLIRGDAEDTPAAEEGADALAPEGGAVAPSDQNMSFDSPGALLKGVLDILNEDAGTGDGGGATGDEEFEAGYAGATAAGGAAAAGAASPMPQKF